jgi:ubiquinone/menaquinone biosynthesis C-methylase UbiE
MSDQSVLEEKMRTYYQNYYWNDLALPDWESRLDARLDEENIFGGKVYGMLKDSIKDLDIRNKRVLIVGAGTGAELFYLHKNFECDLNAIEPYEKAHEILVLKAKLNGFDKEKIHKSCAETLPFPDDSFDLVLSYTVLEHVNDVEKSLHEMKRVVRPNGHIFVEAPNYAFPEEQHYKKFVLPPAYFPGLVRRYLKYIKRYTPFFETINFFTCSDLNRILDKMNVKYYRIKDIPAFSKGVKQNLIILYSKIFQVYRDQLIVIQKIS